MISLRIRKYKLIINKIKQIEKCIILLFIVKFIKIMLNLKVVSRSGKEICQLSLDKEATVKDLKKSFQNNCKWPILNENYRAEVLSRKIEIHFQG